MNPLQMAQQIKAELQAIVWPDGSGQVVFGSQEGRVLVFAEGPPDPSQLSPAFPFALVIVEEGSFDEDDPTLIASQGFSVIVAAQVAGDPYGEIALIGGAQANLGTSPGKGVLELSERARAAVQDLVGSGQGHPIGHRNQSAGFDLREALRVRRCAPDGNMHECACICSAAAGYQLGRRADVAGRALFGSV